MTQKIWKFFSGLKLTLILFLLLATSVLIGSFIIQRPIAEEGQLERAYSPETYWWFDKLGFFDLYHSAWFIVFILTLATNIICCTINMWPRHLKLSRHYDPVYGDDVLLQMPSNALLSLSGVKFTVTELQARISNKLKHFFKAPEVHTEAAQTRLFVNRQTLAHFGVYAVHTGLIIIFAGGVWGSLDGFEGQMALMEGETLHTVRLKNQLERVRSLPFSIKCHDIRKIDYPNGSPKEYFSDLEILDQTGKSLLRKTIQVNDPLSFGGVSFYQADYKTVKDELKTEYRLKFIHRKTGKTQIVTVPGDEFESDYKIPGTDRTVRVVYYNDQQQIPISADQTAPHEVIRFLYSDAKHHEMITAIAISGFAEVDKRVRPEALESVEFLGKKETFVLREISGLQVARDPGAPIVFFGCTVMVIGILWAFFTSHQKVWVNISPEQIVLGGKASRNPWAFRKQFDALVAELRSDVDASSSPAV